MIVTRQRKKKFPWKRILFPLVVVALLVAAFIVPVSRNVLFYGPTGVVIRPVASAAGAAVAPFHFASQQKMIANQTHRMDQLRAQLDDAKRVTSERDRQISSLQTQLTQVQQQLAAQPSVPVRKANAAAPAAGAPESAVAGSGLARASRTVPVADLSASATPDMRRTGQVWESMEPESAAKVVAKLPVAYVARVFSVMSPDAVGQILSNVPPAYAAQLTRDHPELQR